MESTFWDGGLQEIRVILAFYKCFNAKIVHTIVQTIDLVFSGNGYLSKFSMFSSTEMSFWKKNESEMVLDESNWSRIFWQVSFITKNPDKYFYRMKFN